MILRTIDDARACVESYGWADWIWHSLNDTPDDNRADAVDTLIRAVWARFPVGADLDDFKPDGRRGHEIDVIARYAVDAHRVDYAPPLPL